MADATTAARDRVDRALAALERKVMDLKARPASAPSVGDDDLFATVPGDTRAQTRIADLEDAGRQASEALGRAADQLLTLMAVEALAEDQG